MAEEDEVNSAQDWIDDLTDPSDGDGETDEEAEPDVEEEPEEQVDDDSSSLSFEENFRKLVENEEIGNMTVSTMRGNMDAIDDAALLRTAHEQDDRVTSCDLFEERLDAIEPNDHEKTEGGDDGDGGTDTEELQTGDAVEVGEEGSGSTEEEVSDLEEEINDEVEDLIDDEEMDDDLLEEAQVEADEIVDELTEDDAEEIDRKPADDAQDESGSYAVTDATDEQATSADGGSTAADSSDDLPEVDVSSLAPSAVNREEAAEREKDQTLLVWGPEGAGKSHVAHSAPEPICYIDTEGKADELADKFDKTIHYFEAEDFSEAKSAMEQSFDLLEAYLDKGVRGTLVVDSMTAMWEFAKVDYAKFAYQTDDLSEVNFQSELEGEKDWTEIKGRHNDSFREPILNSPYHAVLTAGQKEDYNAVFDGGGKKMIPDGEKWNKYAVKDVVRLRRDPSGRTVGDLLKAAKTRRSFVGLVWPEWESVYDSVDRIYAAEMSPEPVDVDEWPFEVVDGQPVGESPEGSDDDE